MAEERLYGLFLKAKENETRCIERIHGGGRWPSFHQCHRKRGHGKDGLYCKIHDPEVVKAKAEAKDKAWHTKWDYERSKEELSRLEHEAHQPMLEALKNVKKNLELQGLDVPGLVGNIGYQEVCAAIAKAEGK